MGFFDRLFGSKPARTPAPAAAPSPAPAPAITAPPPLPAPSATPPAAIKVFDAYGRMLMVPREEFRTKVLPNAFKKDWNDASALARTVSNALNDAFHVDSLEAARQLHRIDADHHRGATLLGVNLLRLKRFKEAELVLGDAVKQHGPNGLVLVNLAAAQAALGDAARAQKTLWRALETDPNVGLGLSWYAEMERKRGGEPAALEALRRVARLSGSWRARLWLAGHELKSKRHAAALAIHREVLASLKIVPAEALAQISSELLKAGLAADALALCTPRFVAAQHGLITGSNLIQACIAQKDGASARRLLEELYAIRQPAWREQLLKLELAIDQVDRGYGPVVESKALEMTMLVVDRPIWMGDGAARSRLLPAKQDDAIHVAFMVGSARLADSAAIKTPVAKPSDVIGRFARAVPLYLAEQVHLTTDARATFLVPWLRRGGFVLLGRPWSTEALAPLQPRPDYIVLLHFDATREPMQMQWRLVRAIDEKSVAAADATLRLDDNFQSLRDCADQILRELATHADVAPKPPPAWLVPSSSARLPAYCHALEQALAVHCAAQAPLNRPFLSGERNLLDQLLDLTLREPENVLARLVFLTTLGRESRLRAAIAAEYRERTQRLQREFPLKGEAAALAQEAFEAVVWE